MNRSEMIFAVDAWNMLSETKTKEVRSGEKEWFRKNILNFKTFKRCLEEAAKPKKDGGACANKNRLEIVKGIKKSLDNPPMSLEDFPNWIVAREKELLGVPITYTTVDNCDTSQVNTTCKEFLDGRSGYMILGVEIVEFKRYTIKKGKSIGKDMAFLTIEDSSCKVSAVVYSEVLEKYGNFLNEGNTILVRGERDKKKGSLVIQEVWEI